MTLSTEIRIEDLTSIEIRPANNGFVITTHTDEDEEEFVFDSHQKVMRFIKKAITPVKDT